jgi:hypothetical protein
MSGAYEDPPQETTESWSHLSEDPAPSPTRIIVVINQPIFNVFSVIKLNNIKRSPVFSKNGF